MSKVRSTRQTRIVDVDKWLEKDNLMLLECWVRDGYSMVDIANRIGVTTDTLYRWKRRYPEISEALTTGKEIVDYKVENALLKVALGYQTKEVKVTTTMRYGKVVETIKEVTEKEQAPNVSAIQTWLYNRCKEKWKNMNAKQNMFDEMQEDDTVEIIVRRASSDETADGINNTETETEATDKNITLRKRSDEEAEEARKQRVEAEIAANANTHIYDVNDEEEIDELDEWPEDWEDDEE